MILIFGASGFLGSAITNRLAENNQVVAVVRTTSNTKLINQSANIQVKAIDVDHWAGAIAEFQPEIVICAQWDGVAKGERDNKEKQIENIETISRIAINARELKVKKFIALGSQAETIPSQNLVPEEFIDSGHTWYGKSKSQLHHKLIKIFDHTETDLLWARVFSVYGPGEARESLIDAIKRENVTGKILQIREPNRFWSFLYIDDFAAAIESIVQLEKGSHVVNIANPALVRIKDICSGIQDARVEYLNQSEDLKEGYFPVTDKLEKTGWAPRVGLAEGCRITWNSIRISSIQAKDSLM